MSTLTKFIVMMVAWLLFTLLTFYTCVKPECCGDGEGAADNTEQVVAPPAVTDDYSIVSKYGAAEVLTGSKWAAERDALLARFNSDPNQALDVTGLYYSGEAAPAGFENMGLYRAKEIKKLLMAAGIPAANIRTLSRLVSGDAPAADDTFDAGNFAWGTLAVEGEPEKPELVEVSSDEIKIRFPFNKSTRDLGTQVENYLKTLAERVKQSNETISIVGHTDNVDSDAFNLRLGQQRADFVKGRLMSYGVPDNLISTSSKGESEPEATNETAAGRRLNRRAVVRLNRQAQ
ncbi:MAG: OmpA family protein [Bacteroidota bacterium]